MAGTGQDYHDWPSGSQAIGTVELYQGCFGSVGSTAAAVCAGATVARLVGLDTGAVLIGEVNGFFTPDHLLAPTASQLGERERDSYKMNVYTSLYPE